MAINKNKDKKKKQKQKNVEDESASKQLQKLALRQKEKEEELHDSDFSEENEAEDSDFESSGDELPDDHLSDGGDQDNDEDGGNTSGSDDSYPSVEESDSSEDEVAPRNTIGDVPLEFYNDEEHIGYEITGKKIKKKERQDRLAKFLASADDTKAWRKILDEYNDEEVELTKDEIKMIRRILKGKTPHAEVDPYAPYVDWFNWEDKGHPLSNAPEPKRRFIPSKWEYKKIVKYARAIREGRIKLDQPKEEPKLQLLWGDDSASSEKTRGLSYIPPPKPKLPGHEESYNPSEEYIPSQEEINKFQLMYEEDRPKLIPKRFSSFRSVPAYETALKDSLDRCLDLYLCPRVRKKRINVDPEKLKPKVPNRNDLKPYPVACYIEYKGHSDAVVSISTEASGQWIASGSTDGTVRVWDVATGRCIRVWDIGVAVQQVAWNPSPQLPILAVAVEHNVLILDTELGSEEEQQKIKELLHIEKATLSDQSVDNSTIAKWLPDDKHGGVRLEHLKTVSFIEWHRKGDYLSAVMPAAQSRAVLIHQLSKKVTQRIPFKLHGLPVCSAFHPSRSFFFISTKKNVRVYDLVKQKPIKKLETEVREVSCIAVHPGGDNVIVGSKQGKLCWFDMDLSSKPYRTLKCHGKDISSVAFHRSYPLFASCSEDNTAYVFHGMVYSDLNQNPFIVPLRVLRGHSSSSFKATGVLDCKFHPRQPWLFTAGADSVIKLYCH